MIKRAKALFLQGFFYGNCSAWNEFAVSVDDAENIINEMLQGAGTYVADCLRCRFGLLQLAMLLVLTSIPADAKYGEVGVDRW